LRLSRVAVATVATLAFGTAGGPLGQAVATSATTTPIKHVIVIIGENHTYDNVFGTYVPKHGSTQNLLSKGIVNADGSPGPNVAKAAQNLASDTTIYTNSPTKTGTYATLPQPDTTGGFPPFNTPDPRFPANLPNAPYQLTKYVPYDVNFVGDPIHRFYQMWQQTDKNQNDLFVWTANTVGKGDNGANPPAPIHQGGLAMGFYNVQQGDAPFLKQWADQYALADNYHQSAMGGTGVNHVILGSADDVYFSDGKGNASVPPVNQIENPNPKPGTNNNYAQDGYAGGSYSNCSDPAAPGVGPILSYLAGSSPRSNSACANGHYYLLNNYKPGYNADGTVATGSQFTVPPSTVPTIADQLSARGISWGYFGEGWDNGHPDPAYCDICNPFQYSTSIMTNPQQRANIKGMPEFFTQATNGTLPAVSYLKPNGLNDGHPASSQLAAFEDYTLNVVNAVKSNRNLWKDTAIVVTMDEGGGYYDSGYVQPVSFFGDGTRIPTLVISPWARRGFVDHTYYDHVSVLKFIEKNWGLQPLSSRSLDRLPNPVATAQNPYLPTNGPAVGDLMNLFSFGGDESGQN
jgi:acid phosphatase